MKKLLCLIFVALIGCTKNSEEMNYKWSGAHAPIAEQKEHIRDIHNDKVNDPYYWMYDFFGKGPDSTQVIDYLKAENAYQDSMMADTKAFQTQLFDEMKARVKEKDESVPYFKNGYYYYSRTEEGQQYYKYCRKKGSLEAEEELLLDIDKLAEGKAYYQATGFAISPDNRYLAYGVDEVSRRQYTIYVKDLSTGEMLPDAIPNTEGRATWAADNKTLFYTSKNEVTLLSEKINRHELGTAVDTDVTVYEEADKSNYIGVYKSKNGQHIIIYSSATVSSEMQILAADNPKGAFTVFQPRMDDVIYYIIPLDDKFLIQTNLDAENFKVMECPLDKTGKENWKELIPHRSDVLIEGLEAFKDHVVVSERKDGLVKLRIANHSFDAEHYLEFPEAAYTADIGKNAEYESSSLRYNYTSLTTPSSVYDYDLNSKEKQLMKQQEVVGGYDATEYITERLTATATDGSLVPISLVYKKGFVKDGKAPLLLYAYGSYGHTIDASFSSSRLSLLDRGFVYAIAHIRGSQTMGRQWYLDGKMMNKKNTFTDFIDCGQFLVDQNYTSKEHLYAMGGSAGGLLMGAVANMAPDLWNGLIAAVPFVDVVNTMLDESIPLTTNEFDEWGNPKEEEAYWYMKSYSPYENIEAKNYPNILITTGLHDSQVQYFEPAKWIAKLRYLKTDDNVVMLHTNMEYGHGGASGRFDYLKEVALNWAFLIKLENLEE